MAPGSFRPEKNPIYLNERKIWPEMEAESRKTETEIKYWKKKEMKEAENDLSVFMILEIRTRDTANLRLEIRFSAGTVAQMSAIRLGSIFVTYRVYHVLTYHVHCGSQLI